MEVTISTAKVLLIFCVLFAVSLLAVFNGDATSLDVFRVMSGSFVSLISIFFLGKIIN